VWHASAMTRNSASARALATLALKGVGDASLGEWWEHGKAMHLRRRLSRREAVLVNQVRDIRGTPEESERLAVLLADAPYLRGLL